MKRAVFVLFAAALCLNAQIKPPSVARRVDPEYSAEARQAKLQGTVVLSAVITTEGKATEIKVVTALGMGLDEKAVECLKKWSFRPARNRADEPIPANVTVEINFRLL